jgi:serine/threonine-protein kinase
LKGPDGQPLQIVHRDLTPSNVIATWDGVVKVLDFGIVHAQHRMAKTQAGMVKGKAQYLAPEQITGRSMDGRVDQFALAVVLFELLTGRPMFNQDNELACLHAILEGERPLASAVRKDVPAAVDEVIGRATRVDPAARYPSMKAFRDALFDCLGAEVTREALGSRLRELFSGEFESHAQLMGRLSSANAGTDELRNLYEKARHADEADGGSNARTEMMPAPHRAPLPRGAMQIGVGVAVAVLLLGVVAVTSKRKPAPPPEGAITLRSDPPGSAVVLDGKATTWSTPVVLDHLPLGPHRLRLTHPERGAFEREVILTAEDRTPTLDLTLPPPPGALVVRVDPASARVTIDGTPLPLVDGEGRAAELSPGHHQVRVQAPGFTPRQFDAEITAEETSELEVVLESAAR